MSRLLQKPLKLIIIYSLIVVAFSIPVYYYVINNIWNAELDEHNQLAAEYTRNKLAHVNLDEHELTRLLSFWNLVMPGALLVPATTANFPADSVYTISRTDKHVSYEPVDSFRGLITYIRINGKPYKLTIETNSEEAVPALRVITSITLLFFLVLIAGFILLNRYVSSRVWKPFWQTLSKLKEFDLHNECQLLLEKSDIVEFDELNREVNKLIDRNVATFQSQKQFTENASHELQTPLAVMQSKLDLLLQEKNLNKSQHVLIQDILKALNRTAKINKNLLMLAKIDNQQFDLVDDVNLNYELNEIIQLMPEDLQGKNLRVNVRMNQDVIVRMNNVLAQILIQNLLSNAYRHSLPGAIIEVSLTSEKLEIANTGLESLAKEKLFKRFSKPSRGSGTGLGLAIVSQICYRYGWAIDYEFSNKKHVFTVHLK
ncbi:Signal transduction histidine kinase [bacterium A37T11]|nr:Signal transduction histidine kinase [bacterium A37T11]